VSEAPVVTETFWSRRTVTIASILFLLVPLPAHSQSPTRSQAPSRRFDPRIFTPYRTPPSHTTDTVRSVKVSLTPDKQTVQIGEPVRFRARLSRPLSRLFYEFRDDDGKVIGSGIDQTEAEGRFSKPGPHVVTVRVGIDGPPLTAWTTIRVNEAVPLSVQLWADKPQARVGEQVTFRAKLSRPLSGLFYEFRDSDGKVIGSGVDQPEAVGRFRTPGPRLISVLVRVHAPSLTDSTTIQVHAALATPTPWIKPTPTITSPLEVYLSADKNPSSIGESVTFTISTNSRNENQRYLYELNFGDKSKPFQTKRKSVQHVFKTAGNYTASVTVLGDRSHPRAEVGILVDGGTPPWIYVILGGVVILAVRYLLRRKPKPTPPPIPAQPPPIPALPTFHPHWNRNEPQGPQKNVTISYELHFDPNLSNGEDPVADRDARPRFKDWRIV
jgi:hypothetical protein